MGKKIDLEQNFEILDAIIAKMDNPDITLEESFNLYEKGLKTVKECSEFIDRTEKKILILNDKGEVSQ